MKKTVLTLIVLILCLYGFSQQDITITLSSPQTKVILNNSQQTEFNATLQIKEINFTNFISENGEFSSMKIDGSIAPNNVGNAELPVFSKLIEVPICEEIQVIINSYNIEYINLNDYGVHKIQPTQPSYSKSTDPSDIIFVKNENYYNINEFENSKLVTAEYFGIQRGIGVGRMEIRPYRYNPVENILIVYNNINFEISFKNADISQTNDLKSKYHSPIFSVSENLFNYTPLMTTKDSQSNFSKPIKYVIVANQTFQATLQPFVQWKTQMGYNVIEYYPTSGITAASNTAIKSYLQNLYTSATNDDPAPLYVLIIGDHNGNYAIPAFASLATTPANDHITDLYFVTFDGSSDYLPDMFYGRISANTTTELQNALDKIIPYEKYTFGDGSYLNKAIIIGGDDSSYGPSHADAAVYYATQNYLTTANDFTNIYAYYDGSNHYQSGPYTTGIRSNSSQAEPAINSQISAGVGFANYTAHCDYYGWYDPSIRNADIAGWNNKDKYAFMIGNCCLSYQFNHATDAFGEQVIYTANKGAINYIGCSNSSYWNEDVYWGLGLTSISINATNAPNHTYTNTGLGIYDALWHTHGENFNDWYTSGAQMVFKGNTAVQASTSSYKKYYWEIYHNSGDPSLIPYLTEPEPLSMNFDIPMQGATNLEVSTEPYSYIAVSSNNVLLDAKWSGANSSVTLNFQALNGNLITIVGTKQDRSPSINENILPIPPLAPIADFIAVPTTIIEGENVTFTNNSQYAVNYFWDFGDGETSTENNPIHTYVNIGTFTVSLIVSNQLGNDTLIRELYIIVNQNLNLPVANFIFNVTETCDGIVNFTNSSTNFASLLWDFGDGTTSTEINPIHHFVQNGNFFVSLTATNSNGNDTYISETQISVESPATPLVNGITVCEGNSVELTVSGTGTLNWFNTSENGNIINTGNSYQYLANNSHNFYVEAMVLENDYNSVAGAPNKNFGTGGNFTGTNTSWGLTFDAYQPFKINSVLVYATGNITRTIQLQNSQGTVIQSINVSIPSSATNGTRIDLNFSVSQGTGYKLIVTSTSAINLYRNNSGASYPYLVPDVLSITGNNADEPSYYYYFYDWDITVQKVCKSPRAELAVNVIQNPSPIQIQTDNGIYLCGDNTMELTAIGGENGTIYWGGTTQFSHQEITNIATINTPGTYYFSSENNCGEVFSQITIMQAENPVILEISLTPASNAGASDGTATVIVNGYISEEISILWSNGENGQTIENLSVGTYYVTITNLYGCETISSVYIDFLTNVKKSENSDISIYPNPANKFINICFSEKLCEKIELVDILGKINYSTSKINPIIIIDINNYKPGIYFIYFYYKDEFITKKIIVE
ncbi:MAG: C25 family cysteine peptidase [Bacteroidales bacterium]|jgi:PKD repeat protein|nr:C25 family cysteine peptidase [Bacteroidales bacterium]